MNKQVREIVTTVDKIITRRMARFADTPLRERRDAFAELREVRGEITAHFEKNDNHKKGFASRPARVRRTCGRLGGLAKARNRKKKV